MPSPGKGRPTALTPELADRVSENLRKGLSIEAACSLSGIGTSTYHNWRSRGRDGEQPFQDFLDKTTQALADFEDELVTDLKRVARGYEVEKVDKDGRVVYRTEIDWRAGAWLLERKFPDRYGGKQRVELSGPNGGPIELAPAYDLSQLSEGEAMQLYDLLEKAGREIAGELGTG